MENHQDHEYQRMHLLQAIRHAQIDISTLWLHYFGLGGDAGEYEVEAYLHESFTLPSLQRDLLAHAANELIDSLPPPPRAPYSTDSGTDGEETRDQATDRGASRPSDPAANWLLDSGTDPGTGTGAGPGSDSGAYPDNDADRP